MKRYFFISYSWASSTESGFGNCIYITVDQVYPSASGLSDDLGKNLVVLSIIELTEEQANVWNPKTMNS